MMLHMQELQKQGTHSSATMTYSKLCSRTSKYLTITKNNTEKLTQTQRAEFEPTTAPCSMCTCSDGVCTADSHCINIASQYFCHAGNCCIVAEGGSCTNQTSILDGLGLDDVEASWSGDQYLGNAVYCKRYVRQGTKIVEMIGEITKAQPKSTDQSYIYQLAVLPTQRYYLNSATMGNIGRFVNGRCVPNACYENWTSQFGHHVIIVATKDIYEGMSVTVDYGPGYRYRDNCHCGSTQCVSLVTSTCFFLILSYM